MFHRPKLASNVQRAFWLIGALVAVPSGASGAQPSVQQCLEASDTSIELETRGDLLSTRAALRTCASLSCPQAVRDECARRIGLVEQNIPSVIAEVRDASGRVPPGATLVVDGGAPTPASEEPLELEPGSHTLTASAPSMGTVTRRVQLSAREKNRTFRLVLRSSDEVAPDSRRLPPLRAAALLTGGVGLAALATASVFAAITLERKQDAKALCPNPTCTSPAGAESWQRASAAGNITTGFVVGGSLALAVAAGLWFAGGDDDVAVAVGPDRIQFRARF
jgi:hypothetical protein